MAQSGEPIRPSKGTPCRLTANGLNGPLCVLPTNCEAVSMKFQFTLCLLAILSLTAAAQAATISVNTSADVVSSGNGECSLREALNNANADLDTTGGDCAGGTGADTIVFTLATDGMPITLLGAPGDDINGGGDLDVLDDDLLIIQGNGSDLTTIQAGTTPADGVDRVLHIHLRVPGVELRDLTLRFGRPDLSSESGGGILAEADVGSTLTISNSDIVNNQAFRGAGIRFTSEQGALAIVGSTIASNLSNPGVTGWGRSGSCG